MRTGEQLKGGLKRLVKGVAAGPARPNAGRSLILTYHSVGARDHEMNVTPRNFAEQMAWLTDTRAVNSLAEVVERGEGVAITFDDGYRDNLLEAAPILSRRNISASVFIVSGRVGAWLDHDTRATQSQLMSWDEIAEIAAAGWAIGSHTVTHPVLSRLSPERQRREIADSKSEIESRLKASLASFAYPFGSALDYTAQTQRLVRQSGYAFALSNRYGTNGAGADRFALRRVWIDRRDTLETFQAKVERRLERLAWLDGAVGIRARRVMNRLLRAG